MLIVKPVNARLTDASQLNHTSNTFVRLTIGDQTFQTAPSSINNGNLLWYDAFRFKVNPGDGLIVNLFSQNDDEDVLIGETKIDLSTIPKARIRDSNYPLSFKGQDNGDIHIIFQFDRQIF